MEHRGILAKMTCAIVRETEHTSMACVMAYDSTEPYEVMFGSTENTVDGEPAEWYYGRELLAQAVNGEDGITYGEGDVRLFKGGVFLFTMLHSPEMRCLIAFALEDMKKFLALTEEIVPLGSEEIDEEAVDDALSKILEEGL